MFIYSQVEQQCNEWFEGPCWCSRTSLSKPRPWFLANDIISRIDWRTKATWLTHENSIPQAYYVGKLVGRGNHPLVTDSLRSGIQFNSGCRSVENIFYCNNGWIICVCIKRNYLFDCLITRLVSSYTYQRWKQQIIRR